MRSIRQFLAIEEMRKHIGESSRQFVNSPFRKLLLFLFLCFFRQYDRFCCKNNFTAFVKLPDFLQRNPDFRSWVWVIENRKHKNLSTFFKHRESARFSELINDLWTRPNFDASFWIYRHYAGDIFRNLIFCTTIKVKLLYK